MEKEIIIKLRFEKNLESQMSQIHENMNHVKISLSKTIRCSTNLCDQIKNEEAKICRSVQELRITIQSIANLIFIYLNLINIEVLRKINNGQNMAKIASFSSQKNFRPFTIRNVAEIYNFDKLTV